MFTIHFCIGVVLGPIYFTLHCIQMHEDKPTDTSHNETVVPRAAQGLECMMGSFGSKKLLEAVS